MTPNAVVASHDPTGKPRPGSTPNLQDKAVEGVPVSGVVWLSALPPAVRPTCVGGGPPRSSGPPGFTIADDPGPDVPADGATGDVLGSGEGCAIGVGVGDGVAFGVGAGVGFGVGAAVGLGVGLGVGAAVGFGVGLGVGFGVGVGVGFGVGVGVGAGVGVGSGVGSGVGRGVGGGVGAGVGVGFGGLAFRTMVAPGPAPGVLLLPDARALSVVTGTSRTISETATASRAAPGI